MSSQADEHYVVVCSPALQWAIPARRVRQVVGAGDFRGDVIDLPTLWQLEASELAPSARILVVEKGGATGGETLGVRAARIAYQSIPAASLCLLPPPFDSSSSIKGIVFSEADGPPLVVLDPDHLG